MLLTVTTTHNPATDLGSLLRKNPESMQAKQVFVQEWLSSKEGDEITVEPR